MVQGRAVVIDTPIAAPPDRVQRFIAYHEGGPYAEDGQFALDMTQNGGDWNRLAAKEFAANLLRVKNITQYSPGQLRTSFLSQFRTIRKNFLSSQGGAGSSRPPPTAGVMAEENKKKYRRQKRRNTVCAYSISKTILIDWFPLSFMMNV